MDRTNAVATVIALLLIVEPFLRPHWMKWVRRIHWRWKYRSED